MNECLEAVMEVIPCGLPHKVVPEVQQQNKWIQSRLVSASIRWNQLHLRLASVVVATVMHTQC
jgi:hypothetical protein